MLCVGRLYCSVLYWHNGGDTTPVCPTTRCNLPLNIPWSCKHERLAGSEYEHALVIRAWTHKTPQMLVFTVREPGTFYRWRIAFVIHVRIPQSILHLARSLFVRPETYGPTYVCLTNMINLALPRWSQVLSYPTVSPVCKQFLPCVLREPRISSLIIFQVLGPLWTLVSSTVFLHSRRSLTVVGQFLFLLFLRFLEPCLSIFCVVLLFYLFHCGCCSLFWPSWFCILSTWPYNPSRTDFINFTLSASCNSPIPPCLFLFSSFLLFLHHHHHWHNSPFWAKSFFRSFCQLSLFVAAFLQFLSPNFLASSVMILICIRIKHSGNQFSGPYIIS